MNSAAKIRLAVFDWAGTTLDFGCLAPTGAFVGAFASQGVEVSMAEARGPMGLHKKEHLREMLRSATVDAKWRAAKGVDWTEADVEALYADATPAQIAAIEPHGTLIPGVLEAVASLRAAGVKIGGTTGYFRAAARRCWAVAAAQGFATDFDVCADDVPAGRPAPWMLFRVMEATGVFPPSAVVKFGDTVSDVGEGRSAGAWTVGVVDTGNEMGLSEDEFAALSTDDRDERRRAAKRKLLAAGAHLVVGSVAEAPAVVAEIDRRLQSGERP